MNKTPNSKLDDDYALDDRLPSLKAVIGDIKHVLGASHVDPDEFTIKHYNRYGGLFDGRMLRRMGGFESIKNKILHEDSLFQEQLKKLHKQAKYINRKKFTRPLDSEIYIITSAQNATPVHADFFGTLKVASKHLKAELVVIPFRYKNPTSIWTWKQKDNEWWADEIQEHLFDVRKKLCNNLILCADVKIQPTASSPLTGFEALTGKESCIIGHPKMQFRSVPAPTGLFPKILTTTGTCTEKNYTDTKAGSIGAFHHHLGAIIVEIQGNKFHMRQINGDRDDGSFIDLDMKYTSVGVSKAPPALGLVMGDTHARYICPKVDEATFGSRGIVETINPQTLVFHDLIDGDTVNPHTSDNPFVTAAKIKSNTNNVKEEVEHAIKFLNDRTNGRNAVVVDSNHHDFLTRWILNSDWKDDIQNAEFYLKSALAMLESARIESSKPEFTTPLTYWAKQFGSSSNIKFLGPDESFVLGGVECGMHGHRGPNGARGTLKNLSRLGSRVVSGHTHTPGVEEGHYQVGTSTPLRLGYNHGPSSWLNTHCAIYANGKRSLITIIDGDWHIDRK